MIDNTGALCYSIYIQRTVVLLMRITVNKPDKHRRRQMQPVTRKPVHSGHNILKQRQKRSDVSGSGILRRVLR